MDDSEEGAARGRRGTPNSVLIGREARLLVAPVQQKLGAWQAETVKLEVMAQRVKVAGRHDASIAEATRALLNVVAMQKQLLETGVVEAPDAVRTHSRVTDTIKVLGLLLRRLEVVLSDVGEAVDKRR